MFAARGLLLAPVGDGGSGGSGGPPSLEEWGQFLEWKRSQGNGQSAAQPAAAQSQGQQGQLQPATQGLPAPDMIAQIVGATVRAMQPQPQQAEQPRGYAAPPSNAGNAVNPVTSGGVVDFWHMSPAQLEQLGASGVRREYEKHLAEGARLRGAPRLPNMPGKDRK